MSILVVRMTHACVVQEVELVSADLGAEWVQLPNDAVEPFLAAIDAAVQPPGFVASEATLQPISLEPEPDTVSLGFDSAILESQRMAWADSWEPDVERDHEWSPGVPGSISWREMRNLSATVHSEVGASRGAIELGREVVCDGVVSTCSICFEPVHDDVEILTIPCAHRHHAECLTDWLRRKNECPNCRGQVFAAPSAWCEWIATALDEESTAD